MVLLHVQVALNGQCILLQLVLKKSNSCKSFNALNFFFKIIAGDLGENSCRIEILYGKKSNQTKKPQTPTTKEAKAD